MTPRKIVRAMHARRSSRLDCGHFVLVGALIVRVGGRWYCLPCRLDQLDTETTGASPATGQPKETA